jgi:SulP family sulfate permease
MQVSFVILSSRRRAIRAILNGDVVQSCVRRHPIQSSFLKDAGRQIRIIKLQGFLFFGTISNVEIAVRKILDAANWSTDPIRYLVVDFSSASGVDFSAAEAFVRMQRLLDERGVILVLCGCPVDSEVGIALRSVGLWTDTSDGKVVVLENLNDALEVGDSQISATEESCTTALRECLPSQSVLPNIPTAAGARVFGLGDSHRIADRYGLLTLLCYRYTLILTHLSPADMPKADLDSEFENFASSPRANHLRLAAKETITKCTRLPSPVSVTATDGPTLAHSRGVSGALELPAAVTDPPSVFQAVRA